MRNVLLLVASILFVNMAMAQYSLTYQGNPVSKNDTIVVTSDGMVSSVATTVILHSDISDRFVLQRTVADMPEGASSTFCVGTQCFPPHVTTTPPIDLDANNAAHLHIDYIPHGESAEALLGYKVYKEGDEDTNISFYIKCVFATGINDIAEEVSLKAYPNPAVDVVNFSYELNQASEMAIYNIVGEKVASYPLQAGSQNLRVNVSELPAGTYFYSLVSDAKSIKTKRLVIKK